MGHKFKQVRADMVCLAIKMSGALTGNIIQLEASPQRGWCHLKASLLGRDTDLASQWKECQRVCDHV